MSMTCECGTKGYCIDSRQYDGIREVRRRYKCRNKRCKKRWTTIESVAEMADLHVGSRKRALATVMEINNDSVAGMLKDIKAVVRKYAAQQRKAEPK